MEMLCTQVSLIPGWRHTVQLKILERNNCPPACLPGQQKQRFLNRRKTKAVLCLCTQTQAYPNRTGESKSSYYSTVHISLNSLTILTTITAQTLRVAEVVWYAAQESTSSFSDGNLPKFVSEWACSASPSGEAETSHINKESWGFFYFLFAWKKQNPSGCRSTYKGR